MASNSLLYELVLDYDGRSISMRDEDLCNIDKSPKRNTVEDREKQLARPPLYITMDSIAIRLTNMDRRS
jgi:hypothetical protein